MVARPRLGRVCSRLSTIVEIQVNSLYTARAAILVPFTVTDMAAARGLARGKDMQKLSFCTKFFPTFFGANFMPYPQMLAFSHFLCTFVVLFKVILN